MIDWNAGASGRRVVGSIRSEFLRYKQLAEGALAQVTDEELSREGPGGGSSIVTICWHIGGNLRSRFTDFMTTDGEKPWRNRESEFEKRTVARAELLEHWEAGWTALLETLNAVTDKHLEKPVTLRGDRIPIHEALHRALAHVSYHVGQIVYVAKAFRGREWKTLSIPPGGSDAAKKQSSPDRYRVH